jgi:hypothetical protein
MVHDGGAQSSSNPMPKHPHILKRDGRYYYRKRIPSDLVGAGCYGRGKEIKRSLKTSDLKTANRLAMTVALEVDLDFEVKRRELKQSAPGFAQSANGGSPAKRILASLSEIELRDFTLRAFITLEKQENERRSWESDPATREEKLDDARVDLEALEGSPHYQEIDWMAKTRKAMEAEGISTDGVEDAKIRPLADMLRRAVVESAFRTEKAVAGSPYEARDSFFDGLHANSPIPAPAKASKTVGYLEPVPNPVSLATACLVRLKKEAWKANLPPMPDIRGL